MSIVKRGNVYQLRKRVPARYSRVESRKVVWISLHTDSASVAHVKAPTAWAQMIEAWESRLAGDSEDAEARFDAARELAEVRGHRYLPINRVVALPRADLLARVEAIPAPAEAPVKIEAAALLGTVPEPAVTVKRALELYWSLAKDRTLGKSEDQVRRWKNPRIKAVRNFVSVVGDKPMKEISADDMLNFRDWWVERLETENLAPSTANKDLIHLGDVLKTVNRMKRFGINLPLGEMGFNEGEKKTRPPFSSEWIKARILAPGALNGLDTEARIIVLGMINTGYRPSEGAALLPQHIRLDTDVPHISIEGEGRQLKSAYAKRVIPLLGVSLDAFKAHSSGFPTYRDSPDLSSVVNAYFTANGLRETPDHTLYSLRHAFEDRMLAVGIDDRIRRDVFGHRLDRERYGKGASLEHMRDVLKPMAF